METRLIFADEPVSTDLYSKFPVVSADVMPEIASALMFQEGDVKGSRGIVHNWNVSDSKRFYEVIMLLTRPQSSWGKNDAVSNQGDLSNNHATTRGEKKTDPLLHAGVALCELEDSMAIHPMFTAITRHLNGKLALAIDRPQRFSIDNSGSYSTSDIKADFLAHLLHTKEKLVYIPPVGVSADVNPDQRFKDVLRNFFNSVSTEQPFADLRTAKELFQFRFCCLHLVQFLQSFDLQFPSKRLEFTQTMSPVPFESLIRVLNSSCNPNLLDAVISKEPVELQELDDINSVDRAALETETSHRILSYRLRCYIGTLWLKQVKAEKKMIYLANRLVFWRTPIDAIVYCVLPGLLSKSDLSPHEKAIASQMLCWYWPTGYPRIREISEHAMYSLSLRLHDTYETIQLSDSFGARILTTEGGLDAHLQISSKSMYRSHLQSWNSYNYVKTRKLDELGIPSEWSLQQYILRNSFVHDPISDMSAMDKKQFYRLFLHGVALQINPHFQKDMKALYDTVRGAIEEGTTNGNVAVVGTEAPSSVPAEDPDEEDNHSGFFPAEVKSLARIAVKEAEYSKEHSVFVESEPEKAGAYLQSLPEVVQLAISEGNFAHQVLDFVRCAIVAADADEMVAIISRIQQSFHIVRIKNTLGDKNVSSFGYRSVLLTIEYPVSSCGKFLCEVQLMLRSFYEIRKKMHLYYKILRSENAWDLADDCLKIN